LTRRLTTVVNHESINSNLIVSNNYLSFDMRRPTGVITPRGSWTLITTPSVTVRWSRQRVPYDSLYCPSVHPVAFRSLSHQYCRLEVRWRPLVYRITFVTSRSRRYHLTLSL